MSGARLSVFCRPLRVYPVPFAREVCDLFEEMKSFKLGQPQLPSVVPPAIETFQQLRMSDPEIWRHVDLASVYNYLRRSKKLRIPVEWQHLMPSLL